MLTRVTGAQAAAVLASLGPYREMLEPQRQHLLSFYRPVDVAFKVVGTGSVGLRDYCIYFEGNGPGDPLFLQIKEEPASATRLICPMPTPPTTTASAWPKGSAPCRCSPIRFWAGRTSADANIWCASSTTTKVPSSWKTWPAAALQAYRRSLRRAAGARPCPLRRSAGHCRLPGLRRRLCRGAGQIRRALCRPDREGLGSPAQVTQGRKPRVNKTPRRLTWIAAHLLKRLQPQPSAPLCPNCRPPPLKGAADAASATLSALRHALDCLQGSAL